MYLNILNKNHRQALSRFHQHSHNIALEKCRLWRKPIYGKWHNHKIPVEERLCIVCPSRHIETEFYVLMLCNRFSDLRLNLFQVDEPLIANFDNLDVNSRLIVILESQDTSLNTTTCQNVYILYVKGELKLWILVHVTLMCMTVLMVGLS